MRLFSPQFVLQSRWADLRRYFLLSLLTAAASVLQTLTGTTRIDFFAYNSPLVVIASLFLFLFFEKWPFASPKINSLARSSLSVYLFHMHPSVCLPLFVPMAAKILRSETPRQLLIVPYLLFVFAIAVLLDRIRIMLWNAFEPHPGSTSTAT